MDPERKEQMLHQLRQRRAEIDAAIMRLEADEEIDLTAAALADF